MRTDLALDAIKARPPVWHGRGDCQRDNTGDVTLYVTGTGDRTFDPPLPVKVAACDEHRRRFDARSEATREAEEGR